MYSAFDGAWNDIAGRDAFYEPTGFVECDPIGTIDFDKFDDSFFLSIPTEVASWVNHGENSPQTLEHFVSVSVFIGLGKCLCDAQSILFVGESKPQ